MNTPAVSIPMWTALMNPPPHKFRDCRRVLILCAAEPGRVQALLPAPLEPTGDFVVISWITIGSVEGYVDAHNISINLPCRYNDQHGKTCALEYIDVDMGLTAGREMWSWPKKGGDFVWQESEAGIHLECARRGDTLFKADITFRPGAKSVDWQAVHGAPDLGSTNLQVRHIAETFDHKPHTAEVLQVPTPNFVLHSSVPVDAGLEVTSGPQDSLTELGPLRVVAARYDHSEFDLASGTVIGSVKL